MRTRGLLLVVSLAMLFALSVASAQSAVVGLAWFTIDGGSATSGDAVRYSVSGTIGQSDAGSTSGAGYNLLGGFWTVTAGLGVGQGTIYLPLVRK